MCTINFSQTLLASDNTGVNQESSSFALSEPMNGMAVVSLSYFFFPVTSSNLITSMPVMVDIILKIRFF